MKSTASSLNPPLPLNPSATHPADPAIPDYLEKNYWWAYLHPKAVRFFEREWLVNLILWGNFRRLRDLALAELGNPIDIKVLQVACVYGNFTQRIAACLGPKGSLDVVDVAPIQLANLEAKLPADSQVRLHCQDASHLHFADASFDAVMLFFLLHEQPEAVRRATLAEALRVTRPGGRIVIVDYHKPNSANPLRFLMRLVFRYLEPFAIDLWNQDIAAYLPQSIRLASVTKETFFGSLYQKVVLTR